MLQNIRTQTHESSLIQQNQPKSITNSIQGKQCTSSETQTCEEGRKKKEKKKKKRLPRCKEGRKKKERKKNLKNEERKKKEKMSMWG